MNTEPLFWCVWNECGGSPTVKHETFRSARDEARRLARQCAGQRFVVLAAAAGFEKSDLVETRFEPCALDDMIPF